jgi:hypothetical protein
MEITVVRARTMCRRAVLRRIRFGSIRRGQHGPQFLDSSHMRRLTIRAKESGRCGLEIQLLRNDLATPSSPSRLMPPWPASCLLLRTSYGSEGEMSGFWVQGSGPRRKKEQCQSAQLNEYTAEPGRRTR